MTLASEEHAASSRPTRTSRSFDGGYGSALLARQVGQKRAREIFFLGRTYSATRPSRWAWSTRSCPTRASKKRRSPGARRSTRKSPTAMRMLKYAFNLPDEGLVGQQLFAGEATRLAYMTDEAVEGRDAFLEKRRPGFSRFPWYY
jgi:naphthoate synthase